jgi:hypothetical protein
MAWEGLRGLGRCLGNRCSIRLSYGTNGKICALGFLKMLAFVQCMP